MEPKRPKRVKTLDELYDHTLRGTFEWAHPHAKAGTWKPWVAFVREINVELRPGGRATLRHPGVPCTVELRWAVDKFGPTLIGSYVDLDLGQSLTYSGVDLAAYESALLLEIWRRRESEGPYGPSDPLLEPPEVEPPEMPTPGKPPSIGHYERVLREYDKLEAEGNPAPIKELARRYGVPGGTVKSWRSRAHKYLEEGADTAAPARGRLVKKQRKGKP